MAKRLNKNLVVVLTLAGMLVTTVAAVWMLKNLRDQDPELYVAEAERFAEDGKPVPAMKAYLRAHRAAGRKNPRYLILAGDMAMEADDSDYALNLWGTAINLEPKSLEAQRKIVEFRREQARIVRSASIWSQLRFQATRLLSLDDSLALGHNALGLALVGLTGQEPEFEAQGAEHLKRALELAPDDPEYANDLAAYYVRNDRLDEAQAVYLAFLEANPRSAGGMMRYANFLQLRAAVLRREAMQARAEGKLDRFEALSAEVLEKLDEAKQRLVQALEWHPDDPELRLALGQYWDNLRLDLVRSRQETDHEGHTQEQLLEMIRTELTKAIELDPDAYPPYLALGQLYRTQDPPRPKKALQVYKERYERPPASRSGFRGMLNRQNQFRLYIQVVETLLEQYVTDDPSRKQKKRNEEILQEAERFLALAVSERTGENFQTHKLRGRILSRQNKIREAINEFEQAKAIAARPDVETLLLLGDLLSRDGQLGVAYRSVKEALALNRGIPGAWVLLGRISMALDQPQHALESAEAALALNEDYVQARVLQAEALLALGRESEVRDGLAPLLPADAGKAALQQALILQIEGRDDEAMEYVLRVLEDSPADREALRMAVLYYDERDQTDQAVQLVDRALEVNPKDRALQALKVRLAVEDPEERDAKLLEIIAESRNPAHRAIQFFNFYLARGKLDKAREYLDQAEEIDPTSNVVIERQYRMALLAKDFERAEQYVNKAARLNLDGANGEFFRGRLLLDRQEYQHAIEVLRNAINNYPSNSEAYVYLGSALQATGHRDEATEALKTALEYDPTNGAAHLGLAQLAAARRDEEAMYQHLASCEKYMPEHPWVKEQLQFKLEREDPEAGIVKREELRREKPDDVENLASLAKLYVQTDKLDQAVEVAEELLKANPGVEETYFVAGIYRQVGRPAQAESLLKNLVAQAEDELDKAAAQVALGEHYASLAKTPEDYALVEQTYLQAATFSGQWKVCFQIARWYHLQGQNLSDKERLAKALQWYERAHERAEQTNEKAQMARLMLDVLIASRDYERAEREAQAYRSTYPNDLRGLLYEGEIQLQLGNIKEASQIFEQYLEKNPKSAIGYYRRGTIHFIRSDWDKAVDDFAQAKALKPDGFSYMHRKRLALALEERGDVEEAIADLQAVLSEADAQQRTSDSVLGVARLLCEILGRSNRTEAQRTLAMQYRSLMPTDPYWYTVLGQNAMRMGNLYEASQYLKEACTLSNYAEPPVDSVMLAWLQAKDYDQAIDFITNEVPEDRRGGRAHLRWAQALAAKGDVEAAKPHFVTALEMAAGNPDLAASVASVMLPVLGQEGAIAFARERAKAKPDDRLAKAMLASLLGRTADHQSEALSIWKEMVASASTDMERLLPLTAGAQLAYSMKDFDTARNYYQRLVAFYDDRYAKTKDRVVLARLPGVLNNLAYMLAEDLGRPDLALPHIERAVDMVGQQAPFLDTLGWIQVKLGRYRDAVGTLARAIGIQKNAPDFHYHMAEAYAREGRDMDSAAKEFQRAYELAHLAQASGLKQQIEKRAAELKITVTPPSQTE